MSLYSLQRKPQYERSASMLTAGVLSLLIGSVIGQVGIGLGSFPAVMLGALPVVIGIIWTVQGVHRLAANVDVAAEAVYARYAESAEE